MDMKRRAAGFVVALVLGLTVIATFAESSAKQDAAQKDESLRKGEKRATLDPKLFDDARIRMAYQAAREMPWVLDSIYCYCACKESPAFGHKSLLSCYVDNHAAM